MRAAVLILVLASVPFSYGQTSSPDGKIKTTVQGIYIPSVPNAPFTAKSVVTWDQPLQGGEAVSRTYYTWVARDSVGRVRRESRAFVPAGSTSEPPLQSFAVNDPTASMRIVCTVSTKKCVVSEYHDSVSESLQVRQAAGVSRVSLGEQTMQSLRVLGTRESSSNTTGSTLNDRVLIGSRELWYSPDLQIDLSVVRNDPQLGKITLTMTELVRGEPDARRFNIPADYAVVDTRAVN